MLRPAVAVHGDVLAILVNYLVVKVLQQLDASVVLRGTLGLKAFVDVGFEFTMHLC